MKPSLSGAALRPLPLRDDDLLSVDHPWRRFPLRNRVRLNPAVRAVVFGGLFALFYVISTMAIGNSASLFPAPEVTVPLVWQLGVIVDAVLAYLVLVWVMERRPIMELAWRRAPVGLGFGLAAGASLVVLSVGMLAIFGIYKVAGFNSDYSPWVDFVGLGLSAAIIEEIIFRGILLRLAEEWVGTWGAIAGSAIAFGCAHISNPQATWQGVVAIIVEAGLVLGALYALTRNLWVVIGFHFAWNMVQGPIFGLVVSGATIGRGWLSGSLAGPEALTGGIFGFEASLATIILATTAGIWAAVRLHRSRQTVKPIWVRRRILMQQAISLSNQPPATAATPSDDEASKPAGHPTAPTS